MTGIAARAGGDAVVAADQIAPQCCRRAGRGVKIARRTASAMVPFGGSSHACSGGLQHNRITVCLGLPVAYLEAFLVQCAFTPRGRCSDAARRAWSVGDMVTCSTKHLCGCTRDLEDDRQTVRVTLSQPRHASYLRNRDALRVGQSAVGETGIPGQRSE